MRFRSSHSLQAIRTISFTHSVFCQPKHRTESNRIRSSSRSFSHKWTQCS